jgi:hypothetical protein
MGTGVMFRRTTRLFDYMTADQRFWIKAGRWMDGTPQLSETELVFTPGSSKQFPPELDFNLFRTESGLEQGESTFHFRSTKGCYTRTPIHPDHIAYVRTKCRIIWISPSVFVFSHVFKCGWR